MHFQARGKENIDLLTKLGKRIEEARGGSLAEYEETVTRVNNTLTPKSNKRKRAEDD